MLESWRRSASGQALIAAIDERVQAGAPVYPAEVFRALELTSLKQTRVLILGQDPYHGPGQAEGLAFSVPPGVRLPPSLRNIFKELQSDVGLPMYQSGSLAAWAQRGVLLLNSTLTVEDGLPGRHAKLGWHVLTDAIYQALWTDEAPKAFMLWGAHAQAKMALTPAAAGRHLILRCNHPSPLSATRAPAPFIGCGHFSRAAAFLAATGRGPLDWGLPESASVL